MKTWRYDVDRNVVLMTEDGILFAKTTWGNYTYKFETPGVDDFRKFFLDIVGQPRLPASTWSPKARYLIEKFTYDGPRGVVRRLEDVRPRHPRTGLQADRA